MDDDGTIKDTEVNSQTSTNAIELDTKTNDEIVQKQLMVHSYPSLKDLMDRKVTWKEFLGVYNVLRIAIAAVCAIIICLFIFAIIWFINPNKCFPERDNPTKIQWNPIKIQIMNWLELTLCFGPLPVIVCVCYVFRIHPACSDVQCWIHPIRSNLYHHSCARFWTSHSDLCLLRQWFLCILDGDTIHYCVWYHLRSCGRIVVFFPLCSWT
eukprot:65495_1